MNVGFISLGCDKNRVDAEKMLCRLSEAGYEIVPDKEEADVLLINTCAFIEAAKREAIDAIMDAIELKKRKKDLKIVVTGCFSTRYGEEAKKEIPEVDVFLPVNQEGQIVRVVNTFYHKPRFLPRTYGRIITTPLWYAYLKISDGCNNRCSYCAIPYIRGKYHSYSAVQLMAEARALREKGVKELIIVAQDTTNYGIDNYSERYLIPLLRKICTLDFWRVRLLYAYPEHITDELLDFIDNEPKMAKYLDIPMQHVDDDILKRMNRASTKESLYKLFDRIRSRKNYIAVRSSFITGFPGETEENNKNLCDFVRDYIDYAGFFVFSPEEGTPAYSFPDKVKTSVAKRRRTDAEKAWQIGYISRQQRFVGQTLEVLCDGIDTEKGAFYGRTEYQTPEVDTKVYFTADFNVKEGEVYKVHITDVDFDWYGYASKEENEVQD